MHKYLWLFVSLLALQACVATPVAPVVRSKATMDSGAMLSEQASAYSITHYTLRLDILIEDKAIAGSGEITIQARSPLSVLELDFDGLLTVDGVQGSDAELTYTRTDSKLFIDLGRELAAGETHAVKISYHGVPREAIRAPWDGGFVWKNSPSGKPWIATAFPASVLDTTR